MKRTYKQKNILDLKHQRYLNYLNILILSIITGAITLFIAKYNEWGIDLIISRGIIVIIIICLIIGLFEHFKKNIEQEIINLK